MEVLRMKASYVVGESLRLRTTVEGFTEMSNKNVPFIKLNEMVGKYNEMRSEVGLAYQSPVLSHAGEEFTFSISDRRFHLWTGNGSRTLGVFSINTESAPTEEFIAQLLDVTESYIKGFINCSDCGERMRISDAQGRRYFAGTYCSRCWKDIWAEIAAKETYD